MSVHPARPGPDYWSWRCRVCDEPDLTWQHMPGGDVMALTDALMHDTDAPTFVQLTLDDDTAIINTGAITWIEIADSEDEEP